MTAEAAETGIAGIEMGSAGMGAESTGPGSGVTCPPKTSPGEMLDFGLIGRGLLYG